jgi:hypothetical protein
MAKRKRGLHKEITSIFDGVPMPMKPDGQQPAPAAPPQQSGNAAGAPPARVPSPPAPKPRVAAPKMPTPPQPQQTVKSTPKVIATEQPVPEAAVARSAVQSGWPQALQTLKDKLFAEKPGANTAKQKKIAVLIPVLLVVLIFVFAKVLRGPKGTVAIPDNGRQATVVTVASKIDWQIPKPYPTNLRDPMEFRAVPTSGYDPDRPDGELPLKGILHSEDNPAAVVGTKIVHEGDVIFNAKVIEIRPDSVEFERDGKRWKQEFRE